MSYSDDYDDYDDYDDLDGQDLDDIHHGCNCDCDCDWEADYHDCDYNIDSHHSQRSQSDGNRFLRDAAVLAGRPKAYGQSRPRRQSASQGNKTGSEWLRHHVWADNQNNPEQTRGKQNSDNGSDMTQIIISVSLLLGFILLVIGVVCIALTD